MKILCLYANECALELFQWLQEQGHDIVLWTEKLNAAWCLKQRFDLTVSYTYPYIIKKEVIISLNNNIVNLHNSYLPYNRGTSPNIWSILDKTPRGVTLHYIDDRIDSGDIICQKIVPFQNNATLRTSYYQLDSEAKRMFKEAFLYCDFWPQMRKQALDKGTYHNDKDLDSLKKNFDNWNYEIKILDLLKWWRSEKDE